MTSVLFLGAGVMMPMVAEVDDSIRPTVFGSGAQSYDHQNLPTDAVGTFNLTLTNVVVGSSVQVEPQAGGAAVYNGVAAASTVSIPITAYAPGSPNNDLRIKVRKGTSSPFYQPYETLATAVVGSQSIFIAQTPDE